MADPAIVRAKREGFHRNLAREVLSVDHEGVPSIADKNNDTSIRISKEIFKAIGASRAGKKPPGQTLGENFERQCAQFLEETFPKLQSVRPGEWQVQRLKSGKKGIAVFEQYEHLLVLSALCKNNPELQASIGSDYLIYPDIVISRMPVGDNRLNTPLQVVDDHCARRSPLRSINNDAPLLHASVSCKFTMRSDRAQNSRSEALNLIRNRKGRVPHIVVLTAEPLPSRLASLALGTGDIDCVYHFALDELQRAVKAVGNDDTRESLESMVNAKRLRDISDLPLDLAI